MAGALVPFCTTAAAAGFGIPSASASAAPEKLNQALPPDDDGRKPKPP